METLSMILTIGVVSALLIVVLVVLGLTVRHMYRSGRGSGQSNPLAGVSLNRDTFLATALIVFGLIVGFIWWDELAAFPDLSKFAKAASFGVALFVLMSIYGVWTIREEGTVWPKRFMKVGVAGLLIVGFLTALFGERWVSDPLLQKRFDLRTEMPQYMVQEVEGGVSPVWEDGEILHPDDCRPEGFEHDGFNYLENGTCYSPLNRSRLRPVRDGDVIIQSSVKSGLSGTLELIVGNSGEEDGPDAVCPGRIDLRHLKPGGDREICMKAGRRYTLILGRGMGNLVDFRFDDAPLRVHRNFDLFPTDHEELAELARYGEANKLSAGLVVDTARLQANRVGYSKYLLDDEAVYFEVFLRKK